MVDRQTVLRYEIRDVGAGSHPLHELLDEADRHRIVGETGAIYFFGQVERRDPGVTVRGLDLGPFAVGPFRAAARRLETSIRRQVLPHLLAASRLADRFELLAVRHHDHSDVA